MKIRQLHYFRTIVEEGQISRAARKLNMSQPPLSQRLQELEEELGVCLIYRQGKHWEVTPAGERMYHHALAVLSRLESIRDDVQLAGGAVEGLVRLGISPPGLPLCKSLIAELAETYPRLRFRILIADNKSIETELMQGTIDLGMAILPILNSCFTIHKLHSKKYVAVYGPGLAHAFPGPSVQIEELAKYPLLLTRRKDGGGRHDILMRAFQQHSLTPRVLVESPDPRLLIDLLRQGMPVIALMHSMEVEQEGLSVAAVEVPGLDFTPAVIHLKDSYLSPAVQAVMGAMLYKWKQ